MKASSYLHNNILKDMRLKSCTKTVYLINKDNINELIFPFPLHYLLNASFKLKTSVENFVRNDTINTCELRT